MRVFLLRLLVVFWPALALAGLSERQIASIAFEPPPGAAAPLDGHFKNLDGKVITFGDAMEGRPTLLLPVDFTCKQICGSALTIVQSALQETGLTQGKDYSLVVVGIDARDDIGAARQYAVGQVGGAGAMVLLSDTDEAARLMQAIGYQFARDETHDAIAHPAAFLTLTRGGGVARVMSSLAVDPTSLRLALIDAGQGTIGGWSGRLALLCYGFDPVHGIYTQKVTKFLQIASAMTLLSLAVGIGWLVLRFRRRRAVA